MRGEVIIEPVQLIATGVILNGERALVSSWRLHVQRNDVPGSKIEAVPVFPGRADTIRTEVSIRAWCHATSVVGRKRIDVDLTIAYGRVRDALETTPRGIVASHVIVQRRQLPLRRARDVVSQNEHVIGMRRRDDIG